VTRRLTWMLAVAVLSSPVARAQDHNVELSGTAGWVFSDGVTGSGDFARIDPKDAFSWGARIGFLVNENVEVGGLFNQQSTSYEIGSVAGGALDAGDVSIYNYHGYIAYNFGVADAPVRPYFLGGAGVTQYGSFTTALGGQREIGGDTKFSTTWALGLKMFPGGGGFGIRLEGRWTPTYIKSDAEGVWCDPYWGCYTVGDAQYSNQWELSGGITLRF
jgi:Outer membrane protein beta-barrel domain